MKISMVTMGILAVDKNVLIANYVFVILVFLYYLSISSATSTSLLHNQKEHTV